MTKRTIILLGLLCLIGTAGAMGSTNFNLSWNVMGGGGGTAGSEWYGTSSNIGLCSTIGQITGHATSTSYQLDGGFWMFSGSVVPPLKAIFNANRTSGTVPLTEKNAAGSSTKVMDGYIAANAEKPVANFTANKTSGTVPLTVKFADTSTGTPTSWNWTFGDGAVNSTRNPEHRYTKGGIYTVNLTVENAAGSSTKVMAGYIQVF